MSRSLCKIFFLSFSLLVGTSTLLAQRQFGSRDYGTRNSRTRTQDSRDKTGKRATVELEIFAVDADLGAQQKWGEFLANVGADTYRLKTAQRGVKTEVDESSYRNRKHYRIVGVLAGNRLNLPGGVSFSIRDKQKIRDHIQKIRDDGPKVALSKKMAFGLTAEQLVDLHKDLAAIHGKSTKGQPVIDIVEAIADAIKTPIKVDASARDKLAKNTTVAEELKTLSSGTTLAAILRPLGLVAMPKRPQGKKPEIVIIDSRKADEHWPIGWPNERSNLAVAPEMFGRNDYDITNYAIQGILDAVEKKIKMPFLYDHNSMARHGADPKKIKVTLKRPQETYYGIVREILAEGRPQMMPEIRLDEAGTPFMWITTMRK